jgi:hypothetical protein
LSPGERRVYRLGESVFRVWQDRPDAGAEIFKGNEWVWTPIPSGAIAAHPRAVELTPYEIERLGSREDA